MRAAVAIGVLALAARASAAGAFPARSGSSGVLDVPDAEILEPRAGLFLGEFRADGASDTPTRAGPLPLALGVGVGRGLEAAFSVREWALPGDPRPAPPLLCAALKGAVVAPEGWKPGVALRLGGERLNWRASGTLDVVASTNGNGSGPGGARVRLAGYLGSSFHGPRLSLAPRAGLAVEVPVHHRLTAVVQGLASGDGSLAGAALRWSLTPALAITAGMDLLPRAEGYRASVGLALLSPGRGRPAATAATAAPEDPFAAVVVPGAPAFADLTPRLRLRMASGEPGAGLSRHESFPSAPASVIAATERARREVRAGMSRYQPDLDRCAAPALRRSGQTRAGATLRVTVLAGGRVSAVAVVGGDLGEPDVVECLARASREWSFLTIDLIRAVDVPVTVAAPASPAPGATR